MRPSKGYISLQGVEKVTFLRLIKNAQMQVEFYEIPFAGAPEILKSEAYLEYAATTKGEGNAADGHFSTASFYVTRPLQVLLSFILFLAILYTELHYDMAPASALHSNVETTSPSKSHLVRLNPCIEQLI